MTEYQHPKFVARRMRELERDLDQARRRVKQQDETIKGLRDELKEVRAEMPGARGLSKQGRNRLMVAHASVRLLEARLAEALEEVVQLRARSRELEEAL